MSTWNVVTITGADIDSAELERRLDHAGIETGWGDFSMESRGEPAEWVLSWRSKWQADGVGNFAEGLTMWHPTASVSWFEEWDDDEVGQRESVYRRGERIAREGRHAELVPDGLASLGADVRRAMSSGEGLTERVAALCDALVPGP